MDKLQSSILELMKEFNGKLFIFRNNSYITFVEYLRGEISYEEWQARYIQLLSDCEEMFVKQMNEIREFSYKEADENGSTT